jgi:GT2 family glycosyltransferase
MEKADLVIVLVVYKKRIKDIPALNFITNIGEKTGLKLQTIVYDNSPETINAIDELPSYISYVANKTNPGLATAYNYGLEVAARIDCEWMLLLDHDTELTTDYFTKFSHLFEKNLLTPDIAAVMPIVKANETVIVAPVKTHFRWYFMPITKTGKLCGDISGINSGTIVRVRFLKELGGFNLNFPLDYLDHWFFNEVYKASKCVYVVDTLIQHDLSTFNFKRNINPDRYNSILKAQVLFYKQKSFLFSTRLKITLIKELVKHLLYTKEKKFALVVFKNLLKSFI